MTLEFSQQICEKISSTKFHKNPPRESRVVPREQTDGETDMTKQIVAFRKFCEHA